MTVEVPVARQRRAPDPPVAPALVPRAHPRLLAVVVAAGGAGSLATEICASRLLAPFFGSSTVVWANVIGLILIYLSVGYWLGGRYADRHATAPALGRILVVAAGWMAVLPFIAHPVLRLALQGFNAVQVGIVVGSFFSTLALFSVPVTLLGMVSPFALRLAITDVRLAGSVSGRLSSLATMGAIAGTFIPALITIPAVGTQRTMLGAALLVALAAMPLLGRRWLLVPLGIAALIPVPTGPIKPLAGTVQEIETPYQYAAVVDLSDRRVLRIDEGVVDQSIYRPNTVLTGGEWDMPLVVPPLMDRPLRRVLVIGNATGTTARALAAIYPGVRIDGVELDSRLSDLGRRYFGMSDVPGLAVRTADGRVFLATTGDRYDLIVVDAYRAAYIPFYLVTREFFQLTRDHLAPGGAVALNVARVPGDNRLPQAVAGTLATDFPSTYVWPALRFNELVVAFDHHLDRDTLMARLGGLPGRIGSLRAPVQAGITRVQPAADPMTDDRAPVEWLTDRAVLDYIALGGRFDEKLLPTAP
ncbi:MAG: spermine synthase [Chloroflexi bacterium]|nr:MAG: spermine synthase [Chloroflexota bacterium]